MFHILRFWRGSYDRYLALSIDKPKDASDRKFIVNYLTTVSDTSRLDPCCHLTALKVLSEQDLSN